MRHLVQGSAGALPCVLESLAGQRSPATREPWLDLECRSGAGQSQQYLMSYIRHMY
ncbi:protein of unknown function [Paraburkholderia kururiensis]